MFLSYTYIHIHSTIFPLVAFNCGFYAYVSNFSKIINITACTDIVPVFTVTFA